MGKNHKSLRGAAERIVAAAKRIVAAGLATLALLGGNGGCAPKEYTEDEKGSIIYTITQMQGSIHDLKQINNDNSVDYSSYGRLAKFAEAFDKLKADYQKNGYINEDGGIDLEKFLSYSTNSENADDKKNNKKDDETDGKTNDIIKDINNKIINDLASDEYKVEMVDALRKEETGIPIFCRLSSNGKYIFNDKLEAATMYGIYNTFCVFENLITGVFDVEVDEKFGKVYYPKSGFLDGEDYINSDGFVDFPIIAKINNTDEDSITDEDINNAKEIVIKAANERFLTIYDNASKGIEGPYVAMNNKVDLANINFFEAQDISESECGGFRIKILHDYYKILEIISEQLNPGKNNENSSIRLPSEPER